MELFSLSQEIDTLEGNGVFNAVGVNVPGLCVGWVLTQQS